MAFPFRVAGGRIAVSDGPRKVSDDLRHLIATRSGERLLRRDYGSGVHHGLHEPDDQTLLALLRHELEQAIRVHLPQVQLLGPVRMRPGAEQLRIEFDYTVEPGGAAARIDVVLARVSAGGP
jgi:phage baseplate assembly protein W